MTKFFSAKGYSCFLFNYSTRTKTISQNAELLQQWLLHNQLEDSNFICHSMGGLVCRALFDSKPYLEKRSNIVCLGSPFNGSVIAQNLSSSKLGSKLLGIQTNSELTSGVARWPDNSNLGVIAGNRNVGIGRLLGLPSNYIGDGTVVVDETRIEGATDHIILPVTHSQMTFSKLVAEHADYFLIHQRFNQGNDTN